MSENSSKLGNFGNFNGRNTKISAVARTSTNNTMVSNANKLDGEMFNNKLASDIGIKCDTDASNNLIVNKLKCNYYGLQTPPPSGSIIAYRCTIPSNFATTKDDLEKVGTRPTTAYVPRGGWLKYNIPMQHFIGLEPQPAPQPIPVPIPNRDNLIFPVLVTSYNSNSVAVTKLDGTDLYMRNENSTDDPKTWTKLRDLCIPGQ